ncbi:MAG TPA: hypothetical protein PK610_13070, partial [Flavobacteriales bacterium]|nr:hypothetical protein [Flavobacteriales bacterium]
VFGIANLFGQPGKFIPPLHIDNFFLTALAAYFFFFSEKPIPKMALLSLCCSLAISTWLDLNDISSSTVIFGMLSLVFFGFSLIAHSLDYLQNFKSAEQSTNKIWLVFLMLFFATFFFLIAARFYTENRLMSYSYWASGFMAILLLIKNRNSSPIQLGTYGYWVIIALSALFDLGNYLAIRALV